MGAVGSKTDIAVIGLSGRFPGAANVEAFWNNLCEGVESITFFSKEEQENHLQSLDRPGAEQVMREFHDPNYVQAGFILKDVDMFDASFFGYNPSEAELIDPQQRIFLECAWESLENAGYDPYEYKGSVGVFAGTGMSRYFMHNIFSNRDIWHSERDLLALIGNEVDYLPTRTSYKLNLRGPSLSVQSACSSSLVAIHLACQSLMRGECEMALAGGVIAQVPHTHGYMYREGGLLSRDGHCRVFDAKASGTVFSNGGAGCVLLKPLDRAQADRDNVYAVIKGSAANNDGSSKSVMTAPSVEGQVRVISEALDKSGISPESITYVEAHGTGTLLGDPIEMSSLAKVYQTGTDRKRYCAVGSVKANIGHLDRAAGVAGFIKTALALSRKKLLPSINFESPNPRIDFSNGPFYVNRELTDWTGNGAPRRAGVNSFGVGGTNAHVILEEAPELGVSGKGRPWQLLALSARSETALAAASGNLASHLEKNQDLNIADVSYTLHVGRRAFAHRRIVAARDVQEAIEILKSGDPKRQVTGVTPTADKDLVFMFSGQGAQYVNMGRELYEHEDVFREQIDHCASLIEPHLGCDIRSIFYPKPGSEETAAQRLTETSITQPALFIIEYALARLLLNWGMQPQAMIGHSIGEYVAACLAGVFSLEDALKLVAARGRLMQTMPAGSMLSVGLAEEKLLPQLDPTLSLAASNAPAACVVSGPEQSICRLEQTLSEKDIHSRRLHTSHAFHSGMMEPILASFTEIVKSIRLHAPAIPYISNVTGTWITERDATDPGYWARHLRGTVRFSAGVQTVQKDRDCVLLEIGPGTTLSTLARQSLSRETSAVTLSTMNHPLDPQAPFAYFLTALGRLWLHGIKIDWSAFYARQRRNRLALPTYPFERQRYWIEAKKEPEYESHGTLGLRSEIENWFSIPSWKRTREPGHDQNGDDLQKCSWLIFCDRSGMGSRLARRLPPGHTVFTVVPGSRFSRNDEKFTINTGSREDYVRLLSELSKSGSMPERIVHLWSVAGNSKQSKQTPFEEAQERGFYSMLFLAQALGKHALNGPVKMTVVTTGTHDVTGGEPLFPETATILGPCKVIPLEYPDISCRNVDIEIGTTQAERDAIADGLAAEVMSDSADTVVALRKRRRWVQIFERIDLPASERRPELLREGGVYLITGGLGGIGLVLAEYLARTIRPKLALIARTKLPPAGGWDLWLETHEKDDPTSRKIVKIRSLEAAGTEVLVLSADVTDRKKMSAAVAKIHKRFGAVNGVIHSAGVPAGGMIQLKTCEAADQILAPKAQGCLILEELLKKDKLDFMMLCSSLFAVSGGIGQVDYCAANSFMDAFAHSRNQNGHTVFMSVNWDAWREVGMAVNMFEQRSVRAVTGHTSKKMEHPLLWTKTEENADTFLYTAQLSASTDWILKEHKLFRKSVVPGTAYLELIRASFEDLAGKGTCQLDDVFFMKPLEVRNGSQKQVHLILNRDGDGFACKVRTADDQGAWADHVTGKVRYRSPESVKPIDLDHIKQNCAVQEVVFEDQKLPILEKWDRDGFLSFGPRWRSLKRIHLGKKEALAYLELPHEFSEDVRSYKLHPALLDMAVSISSAYVLSALNGGQDEIVFLPVVYSRLYFHAPLPAKIYSYIRCPDDLGPANQNPAFDITLTDETGVPVVEIKGFTLRKVPQTVIETQKKAAENGANGRMQQKNPESASPAQPSALPLTLQGLGNQGILPEEGADAFLRIVNGAIRGQVVVSTTDLKALMREISQVSRSSMEQMSETVAPKSVHPRPDVQTPYAAPGTDLEKALAQVWQVALGIDKVGIHDNFFELGADSVLGVQVISKARAAGIILNPSQLFEFQTIAELATVAEQGASGGEGTRPGSSAPLQPAGRSQDRFTAEDGRFTPSDFPDADLNQEELDRFMGSLDKG